MTKIKHPLVSIIVPVYNTEQYLLRCLASIQKSTYRDYEVIVVDDGSTDSSPSICDSFAEDDSRFHVIHTDNCGVSHARNVGLDNTRGEYIIFIDSDDEIGKDRIESLLQAEPKDIVFGKYTNIIGEERTIVSIFDDDELSIESYREMLRNNMNLKPAVVWNGCYSAKLINDNSLRFDENKIIGEDILFNFSCLEHCQTVGFVNNCEYYHHNVTTSLLHHFYPNKTEHEENELKVLEQFSGDINLRNRFLIWHKTINYYSKWQNCKEKRIKAIAKKENMKCFNNSFFRESLPYIRRTGSLDEKIETYLMGYYRHKLYDPMLKILKLVKGVKG